MPDEKGNMKSCSVPWGGQEIPHGASVTAYEHEEVPYGEELKSEQRFCNDGVLSGSFGHQMGRSLAKGEEVAPGHQ